MSDEHHEWPVDGPLPELRPHSAAKHRVIASYLSKYVDVLTSDLRIPELRLTLVDGFSGGGLYVDSETQEQRFGSPFIMLKAMHDAEARAQAKRTKPFQLDVRYLFIERSTASFHSLTRNLQQSEFGPLLADRVQLVNGIFVDQVETAICEIRARRRGCRAIFLLDQCGYRDVPFGAIRSILSQLGKAEVILTFATDSLIDYLSESHPMQETLENLGLEITRDQIRQAKQQKEWRRAIQIILHKEIFQKSGASFYTPFFIRSKDAHRDYWLVHLSQHAKARDVMVGLHWDENTSFAHFGGSGLLMLGYDQDDDARVTRQRQLSEFRFDEMARQATLNCLVEDLPGRLAAFSDGVVFQELFVKLSNEMPATSEILKSAIGILHCERIVEIRDRTGLVIRQAGIQEASDVVRLSRQLRLPFGEIAY